VSDDLDGDLRAWEAGAMTGDDLRARHGEGADRVLSIHERLSEAGAVPVPDVDAGWAALRERLDIKVVTLRPRRRRRAVLLAVAAALAISGSAFAATGGRLFHSEDPTPPAHPGVIAPASDGNDATEDEPGAAAGTGDASEAAGDHDETDADDEEADEQQPADEGEEQDQGEDESDPQEDQSGEDEGHGSGGSDEGSSQGEGSGGSGSDDQFQGGTTDGGQDSA
jgi:hypothetical protein